MIGAKGWLIQYVAPELSDPVSKEDWRCHAPQPMKQKHGHALAPMKPLNRASRESRWSLQGTTRLQVERMRSKTMVQDQGARLSATTGFYSRDCSETNRGDFWNRNGTDVKDISQKLIPRGID